MIAAGGAAATDGMDKDTLSRALVQAEKLCDGRGVRLTDRRRLVLELVCRAERPIGAYEILDALCEQVKRPAPTLVCRAPDFLLEQGLIHCMETLHAFIGCTRPEHPHATQFLIRTDYGGIRELDDQFIHGSLRRAAAQSGFAAQRRVVEVIGTCARCTGKAGPGGGG